MSKLTGGLKRISHIVSGWACRSGEVRQGCKFVTGYRNAAGAAESLNGEQLVKAKGKILDTVVGRRGKECNRIRDGNKIRAGNEIRAGNRIRAGNEIRAENRIAGV